MLHVSKSVRVMGFPYALNNGGERSRTLFAEWEQSGKHLIVDAYRSKLLHAGVRAHRASASAKKIVIRSQQK